MPFSLIQQITKRDSAKWKGLRRTVQGTYSAQYLTLCLRKEAYFSDVIREKKTA